MNIKIVLVDDEKLIADGYCYSLLKKYDIEPKIYYIKTPKEVCMERIRKRNGNHQNDIILTEQTASTYYDHFQPPTDEEGEVIVVEGY